MINKPIYEWKEQDLQELITKKICESLKLEYKQSIDIAQKKDKKELCKDVSAMANSFGGKIIYGLEESGKKEEGSIPVALKPIKDQSLKESMQQILVDGILPRIDFQIDKVESQQFHDHEYVVIDIPQSIRGPHFVCIGKENRFYKRREFEAKPMDQSEIENAYHNFFFQEMKTNNLYDQIKKDNPNGSLSLPHSAYCSIYFIPQYPVIDLFYKKFNHSSITKRVVSLNKGYLKAYKDVFYNSFDGLTNIRKTNSFFDRKDTFFRNGSILYSFSLFRQNHCNNGNCYISLDAFSFSLLKILNLIPYLYKECGYLGNLEIIMNLECIDNFTIFSQGYIDSSYSIPGGKFESKLPTRIDKLIANPKQESIPLLTHFIQSFGVNDSCIDNFFSSVYLDQTFGMI